MSAYNAAFQIDQTRPSGRSDGSPGVSRRDLWLGRVIHFVPTSPPPGASFYWEMLDRPASSTAVLVDEATGVPTQTAQLVKFTPDVWGTYRVRLTINRGQFTNTQLAAALHSDAGSLMNRNWRLPAFREVDAEGNFPGQFRGYADDYDAMFYDILRNGFGGALGGGVPYACYLLAGVLTTNAESSVPQLAGSTYFNPGAFVEEYGRLRDVRFKVALHTTNAAFPAYAEIYDRDGITGAVGSIVASVIGPVTGLTASFHEVDLTPVLGTTVLPGMLDCRVWAGASSGTERVICSMAKLDIRWE